MGSRHQENRPPLVVPRRKRYQAQVGGPLPDPCTAADDVAAGLLAIVRTEGPVLQSRVFRLYRRHAGIVRSGSAVERYLRRAIRRLLRAGTLVGEPGGPDGALVLRTPDTPPVRLRTGGGRDFAEIPLRELGAVMRTFNPGRDPGDLYRQVLAFYGIGVLTHSRRTRLDAAFQLLKNAAATAPQRGRPP